MCKTYRFPLTEKKSIVLYDDADLLPGHTDVLHKLVIRCIVTMTNFGMGLNAALHVHVDSFMTLVITQLVNSLE